MRYQAALRPDVCGLACCECGNCIRASGRDRPERGSATQDRQHFLELLPHLAHDLVRDRDFHAALRAFEALARAGDREALVVKERADLADHQHVVALVIAAIAASLDRLQVGEFLLPIAQHMRLDAAQFADFPNGEIAFGRYDRQFAIAALIQHRPRPGPSAFAPDGTSRPAARRSESPRRSWDYARAADS